MSDDDKNTEIWHALYKSDPAHVKPITGKSYKGSSPKPHWIIWKLTEQFGPVGKGFGWSVIHSAYIDSIPHQDGCEKRHECRIRFWWSDDDGRHELESEGGTKSLYKTKSGYWVDDEDAAKKSLTDAIIKAASWLGAAGDIFMGQWDDHKYQEELRAEKQADVIKVDPFKAFMAGLESAQSIDELGHVWSNGRHMQTQPGAVEAKDKRKAELSLKAPE